MAAQVGVVHDIRLQELRLYTDYGRCCRPLFIVDGQALLIKKGDIHKLNNREVSGFGWQDLVYGGSIECAPSPPSEDMFALESDTDSSGGSGWGPRVRTGNQKAQCWPGGRQPQLCAAHMSTCVHRLLSTRVLLATPRGGAALSS